MRISFGLAPGIPASPGGPGQAQRCVSRRPLPAAGLRPAVAPRRTPDPRGSRQSLGSRTSASRDEEGGDVPGGRHTLERLDAALFDDRSPRLDRFGVLLLIVVGTLVVLSQVDIRPSRGTRSDVGAIVVTLFVSTMVMLPARASDLARRSWRRSTSSRCWGSSGAS